MDDAWETGPPRRGGSPWLLLAGVGLGVAVTAGLLGGAPGPGLTPSPTPAPLQVERGSEPVALLPPQPWRVEPPTASPLEASAAARAVWTGTDLLALGLGSRAVAAYQPAADRWRSLPPAPPAIPFREGPDVLWTGAELVVWGGRTHVFHRQVSLGTALDTSARRWRTLPQAPVEPRVRAAVVWTGGEVIVWGGRVEDPAAVPGSGPAGAAYSPGTDSWRPLAPAPVPDDVPVAGAALNGTVIVWGGGESSLPRRVDPFAASYDPAADRWTVLPAPPLDAPARAHAAWTGTALLLWGRPVVDAPAGPPAGVAFDPARGRWEPLPPVPPAGRELPPTADAAGMTWTGRQLVVFGGRIRPLALAWDAATGRWAQPVPAPPPRADAVLAWTGREVLVWGGHDGSGPSASVVRWRPG